MHQALTLVISLFLDGQLLWVKTAPNLFLVTNFRKGWDLRFLLSLQASQRAR
ncbi:hypothetical protein I3843_14G132800 [Carya illinoinensis]|nr:hypothetical protein I3843_14G132800 [Carya illinoinensis]